VRRKTIVECPVHLDHAPVERARVITERMSTGDLLDWTSNVAYDVAKLVDLYKEGKQEALPDMLLADAMLHACVVEIASRHRD
jgi:hypothetical protein